MGDESTIEKIYRDNEYEPLLEAERGELVALAVRIKAILAHANKWADGIPNDIRDSQKPAEDKRFEIDARTAASTELGNIMGALVALEDSLGNIDRFVKDAIVKLKAKKR